MWSMDEGSATDKCVGGGTIQRSGLVGGAQKKVCGLRGGAATWVFDPLKMVWVE